jgi:hypothetical protein
MKCERVVKSLYEESGEGTLFLKCAAALHIAFCASCGAQKRKRDMAERVMRQDFFPDAPDITNRLMALVHSEARGRKENAALTSPRVWIVAGFFILVVLTTAFFGGDFHSIAASSGLPFTLPLSITIGAVITAYGALSIGTHLTELCKKFGLGEDPAA